MESFRQQMVNESKEASALSERTYSFAEETRMSFERIQRQRMLTLKNPGISINENETSEEEEEEEVRSLARRHSLPC